MTWGGPEMMKNRYVSIRCPSCGSTVQMKARSIRSDIFYCPVCETGEIKSPNVDLIIYCQKVKASARQPVAVPV
jgi:Zn-finger nucleic acid-binding protein